MQILWPLDFAGNEIQNAKIQSLASDPSLPGSAGRIWYNSTDGVLKFSDGTTAYSMKAVSDHGALTGLADDDHSQYVHVTTVRTIVGVHTFNPASTNPPFIIGANATNQVVTGLNADKLDGSDAAAFSLTSHNHTINSLTAPTGSVDFNSQKIVNLLTPTADNDAANKSYVDAARSGLSLKDPVRVATTANITLSGDQTIDGIDLDNGDRVLVKDQTTGLDNGIYIANVSGAWTRATDADSSAEMPTGTSVWISEGTTQADQRWSLTTNAPIVLGTTALVFTFDGSQVSVSASNVNTAGVGVFKQKTGNNFEFRGIKAASTKATVTLDAGTNEIRIDVDPAVIDKNTLGGSALSIANGGTGATDAATARSNLAVPTKYATNIGDGTATDFVVTHSLGTRDVMVIIRSNSGSFDVVLTQVEMTSTNTVTIRFNVAPLTAQYRVIIIG